LDRFFEDDRSFQIMICFIEFIEVDFFFIINFVLLFN